MSTSKSEGASLKNPYNNCLAQFFQTWLCRSDANTVWLQILSWPARSFSKNLSERDWLRSSARIWDMVKKSAVISEYCKALQSSGWFRKQPQQCLAATCWDAPALAGLENQRIAIRSNEFACSVLFNQSTLMRYRACVCQFVGLCVMSSEPATAGGSQSCTAHASLRVLCYDLRLFHATSHKFHLLKNIYLLFFTALSKKLHLYIFFISSILF